MNDLRTGLSYGDVLLVPQRSPVDSRSDVDLSTRLTPSVELASPLVSAAMDTVTEAELAIELARAGGMGVLHRFLTVDEQATQVEQVAATGSPVAAAVGINEDYIARSAAPAAAGVDALVVDVAHGHLERTITAVETIADEFPDVDIVAGNVATPAGVEDLAAAGADCVKVGIGPGSRTVPRGRSPGRASAAHRRRRLRDRGRGTGRDDLCRRRDPHLRRCGEGADGGCRHRDAREPLCRHRRGARRGRQGRRDAVQAVARDGDDRRRRGPRRQGADVGADEGVEALTPYKGPVAIVAEEFCQGIRSGLSYCGGHTIERARDRAEFIRVAPGAKEREGSTPDDDWEGSAWTARRSESPTRTAKRRPKAATDYRAGAERRIRLDDRPAAASV